MANKSYDQYVEREGESILDEVRRDFAGHSIRQPGRFIDWPVIQHPIVDPTTGEEIDPTDVDALAEAVIRLEDLSRKVRVALAEMRIAIGQVVRVDSDAATWRVRGRRHRIKVVLPGSNWDQATLKRAIVEYGRLAARYIRPEVFGVVAKEIKKLRRETGGIQNPTFNAFKDLLLGAERPTTAAPKVELESSTSEEIEQQGEQLGHDLIASVLVERGHE